MQLTEWKDVTEIASNIVITLAAFAGGVWAVFRFWRERTDEAALDLVTSQQCWALGMEHLVVVSVELANRGKTKIQAKTQRTASGLAFDDGVEKLAHCCSLQIRKLQSGGTMSNRRLDWFEPAPIEPLAGLPVEINLLSDHEEPEHGNTVNFWLEPGETYQLRTPLILPAGLYLAKVAFVGPGDDSNFWTQVSGFRVPTEAPDTTQPKLRD